MSSEIDLKPCPYCREEVSDMWFDGSRYYQIGCLFCGMRGPVQETEEDAKRMWNELPRAQVWSSEPPSEPGFWWWELCGQRGVDLIQDPEKRVVRDCRAKWAGPITEPKETKR